jgi:hypothetical protein
MTGGVNHLFAAGTCVKKSVSYHLHFTFKYRVLATCSLRVTLATLQFPCAFPFLVQADATISVMAYKELCYSLGGGYQG